MPTPALVQVLGNATLFHQVTAFIPGVPYFVIHFKDTEYAGEVNQATTTLGESSMRSKQANLALWQLAILRNNKRVIRALNELSEIAAYESNWHVSFSHVMEFALAHTQDLTFLDWLDENFTKKHHRRVSYQLSKDIAQLRGSAIPIVQWLAEKRNYAFTDRWMEAAAETGNLELVRFFIESKRTPACTPRAISRAAGSGNLELVRYLHEHVSEGWATGAMDSAAGSGHLEIVKFLHENRNEGCTYRGQGCAMERGHIEVFRFLHENRNRGYHTYSVDLTAKRGWLDCIKYAHEHNLSGFSHATMSQAVAQGHLEIVKYLHENRTDGCAVTAIFEAEANGHHEVVDFLCQHRPIKNLQATAIERAIQQGQQRLVESLPKTPETTKKFHYFTAYQQVEDYNDPQRLRIANCSGMIRRTRPTRKELARTALLNDIVAAAQTLLSRADP